MPARGTCTFGTRTCDCIEERWRGPAGPLPTVRRPRPRSDRAVAWSAWLARAWIASAPRRAGPAEINIAHRPSLRSAACAKAAMAYAPTARAPATASNRSGHAGHRRPIARTLHPPDRSACTLRGVVCEYPGGTCECRGMSGWRCGRGVMNDPEDAGVPPGPGTAGATAPAPGAGAGATSGIAGQGAAGVAATAGTSASVAGASAAVAGAGGS